VNSLARLHRIRWGLRATLALGVAASVAANVLHARNNPVSQVIAAWPPLALLLTVEWISRVPVHRRSLAVTRIAATAIIAGIAGWVSYQHMLGVAARYGETGLNPYLLPVSVDGLIVVASISLVELAGHIRTAEDGEPATADRGEAETVAPQPLQPEAQMPASPLASARPVLGPTLALTVDALTRANNGGAR
jgi:hypothetical protein